ncbi:MAG: hypothetical protein DMG76_24495 [Acidobacteria bacterium]|nr:MAG: hypothetical protein DMG76_24495 [Acidobacteriota bacterium]
MRSRDLAVLSPAARPPILVKAIGNGVSLEALKELNHWGFSFIDLSSLNLRNAAGDGIEAYDRRSSVILPLEDIE